MRHLAFALLLLLTACQSEAPARDEGSEEVATAEKSSAPIPAPAPTPDPIPSATASAVAPAMALDGEGLRFVDPANGRTRLLAFGAPRAQAEAAFGKAVGKVTDRSSNDECGAGKMEFTSYGPFVLNFQDGLFVGWWARSSATFDRFATIDGLGVGSTRRELEAARSITMFPDSTLGVEFAIEGDGEIYGLFSGEGRGAKITDLWAGTDCSFR